MYKTILITGCGGDIGQSIAKILRQESPQTRLIGCDIHLNHAGKIYFDDIEVVPKASSKDYFLTLSKIVTSQQVDLIIPMSEAEIMRFTNDHQEKEQLRIPVLTASENVIKIGLDKLSTANFLKAQGLNHPWTIPASQELPAEFPCVMKMRSGQGSKQFTIIENMEVAKYYQKLRPNNLWQEYLLPNDREYTCGVYRTKRKEIRTIVIRRTLSGGLTATGEIINNHIIDNYLRSIAEKLDFYGSINLQLRLTKRGPVLFEINPRFSSTVVFRHLVGFRDLIWSLQELKGISLDQYLTPAKQGTKIFRCFNEVILEP